MTWYSWSSNCIGVMGHYFGYKISNRKVLWKLRWNSPVISCFPEGMPFGVDRKTSWAAQIVDWKRKTGSFAEVLGIASKKRLTEWNNLSVDGKESMERWSCYGFFEHFGSKIDSIDEVWWEHSSFWHNRWSPVVFFWLSSQESMCIFSTRRFRIDVLTVVPASDAPLAWSTWEWWGFWESIPLTTKNLSWNENSPKTGWWLQIYLSIFFEDSHFDYLTYIFQVGGSTTNQVSYMLSHACLELRIFIFRWWTFPWDKSRIPAANFTEAHSIYWSPRFVFFYTTHKNARHKNCEKVRTHTHTQPLMFLKPNIFRGVLASAWCHD